LRPYPWEIAQWIGKVREGGQPCWFLKQITHRPSEKNQPGFRAIS